MPSKNAMNLFAKPKPKKKIKQSTKEVHNSIPKNSEIHSSGSVSKWDGKLGIVYTPLGKTDFDPKEMAKCYRVYFLSDVYNENNETIKVNSKNEHLVGKSLERTYNNTILIDTSRSSYNPRYTRAKTLTQSFFWIKTNIKDLNSEHLRQFSNYLEKIGYVNCTGFNIPKSAWIKVFKMNDFDKFYDIDVENGNEIYELVTKWIDYPESMKDIDESIKVKAIKGVFAYYKNGESLRYVVNNKNLK